MNPERMARLVAWWVRLYTLGLDEPVARRRIEELDADVHDHIAQQRAAGVSDRRIALVIASRLVRGMVADAAWRRRQPPSSAHTSTWEKRMPVSKPVSRSAARVVAAVAVVLAVPLVAMIVSEDVAWGVGDFMLAGVLVAAIATILEMAARTVRNPIVVIGAGTLAVGLAVLGQADDAPGLVVLGIALFLSAGALGLRGRRTP
jgi:hypothetical protein